MAFTEQTPLCEKLFDFSPNPSGAIADERRIVLRRTPMSKAITYALNQWTALCVYTTQGFLAIDNNAAERSLKRVALGRKNWLFAGNDEAAADLLNRPAEQVSEHWCRSHTDRRDKRPARPSVKAGLLEEVTNHEERVGSDACHKDQDHKHAFRVKASSACHQSPPSVAYQ